MSGISKVSNGLGYAYSELGDYDSAEKHHLKALEIRCALTHNNIAYMNYAAATFNNLLSFYNSSNEFEKMDELKQTGGHIEAIIKFIYKYLC